MQTISKLSIYFLFLFLIGCVGAIKEEKQEVPVDESSLVGEPTYTFNGIVAGEPSSDSQINLYFKPAELINPIVENNEDEEEEGATKVGFLYKVTRDGSEEPISSFVDANLTINPEGLYVVSVPTNGRGDCGTFNITATRADNLEQRSGEKFYKVCSENDYYPKFEGLLSAGALGGCDLYTGAKLNWRVAEESSELKDEIKRYEDLKTDNLTKFSNGEIDATTFNVNNSSYDTAIAKLKNYSPASYEVYYAKSEKKLIENLNNESIEPSALITSSNDTSIDLKGLESGVEYFFAIRAATSLIPESSKKNVEKNLVIKRYTIPTAEKISFNGLDSVNIPDSTEGYNSAVLLYKGCKNCDAYYYYAKEDTTPLDPSTDVPTAVVDLSTVATPPESFVLNGLEKHKKYFFYTVAVNSCGNDGKVEYAGDSTYRPGTTTPKIAPFNGVKAVEPVGGALDRLEVSWDLPDTTNGVYDLYNVYQTDNAGNILRQLTNTPQPSSPFIEATDDISQAATNSITVLNLEAGPNSATPNEYCFMVVPKESDFNGPLGIGREQPAGARNFTCRNFYYQAPNFAGPMQGNCNATSSTFTVNYPVPTDGTYSQFRLYYKVDEGETLIDYTVAETDTATVVQGRGVGTDFTRLEFDYNPLNTPSLTPPAFAGDVSPNPFVITGLEPDTTYVFAMETYYDPDGPGAAAPFYIRPSVLRSCTTQKPDVVHNGWDHIMALGPKTNGLNNGARVKEQLSGSTQASLDFLGSGSALDTDKLEWWFMEENDSAQDSEGHVFLSWYDFKFSQIGNFANTLVPTSNKIQYVITRSPNSDMSGAQVIGSVPLVNGVFLYHFYDNNIPAHSTRYYYEVKLQIDDIDLVFGQVIPEEKSINDANAILEVVIPPPNMSFIHRFMFNKHQCRRLDRTIFHGKHVYPDIEDDRSVNFNVTTGYAQRGARGSLYNAETSKNYDIANNYRCEYNGIGSTFDSVENKYFFDIGKSFLVDRFEAGTKIGLVGDNPCDLDGANGGPYPCIAERNTYRGVASKDTIWYELGHTDTNTTNNRFYRADIWINNSALPTVPSDSWERVDNLTLAEFENISNDIFSNEAYLPPARLHSADKRKAYCTNRDISIGDDTYTGRLGSRQEFIVFGGWHEQQAPLDLKQIAHRVDYTKDKTQYGCNTEEELPTRVPYQTVDLSPPDITKNNYPSRNDGYRYDAHLLRTGSYANASVDPNEHSSHLCFSKFGLQDYVGNELEATDDWFNYASGEVALDLSRTPEEIAKYWLNTPKAPKFPLLPAPSDYYGRSSMSWDGQNSYYFEMVSNDTRFYNPLAGLKFACSNTLWAVSNHCHYDRTDNSTSLQSQPDWMNYLFAANDRNDHGQIPSNPADGRPGALNQVARELGYIPFYYEYMQGRVRFPRATAATPLTVGGAGYSPRNWEANRNSYETNLNYGVGSVYTMGEARQGSEAKYGFRCVFSID